MRTRSKNKESVGNASDQVVIGFSVESDWSRKWVELSGPIKAQSKARTNNFWRELYF